MEGSEVTPVGKLLNVRVTSWSKCFSRWMLMDTSFRSPLRLKGGGQKGQTGRHSQSEGGFLPHRDLKAIGGIGSLRRGSRHLDGEVTQGGIVPGLEREFRFRIPVLDGGGGRIEGHPGGQVGERERHILVEVLAALDADRNLGRVALLDGGGIEGQVGGYAQMKRVVRLTIERFLCVRVGCPRSPRGAPITTAGEGNQPPATSPTKPANKLFICHQLSLNRNRLCDRKVPEKLRPKLSENRAEIKSQEWFRKLPLASRAP